jgi:inhibitor of cysteine peptidase
MKKQFTLAGLCILCIITIFIAGCAGSDQMKPGNQTKQATPEGTAVQVGHYVFTGEQNNATVLMKSGNTITLKLNENPTTGFQWNLTTTPGLKVTGDIYVPSDTTGKLVGSGGMHIWEMTANGTGAQKIDAVYQRSWETTTGNETAFRMTIIVE